MNLEINDDEKAIILELLHKSQAGIPVEIHHCKMSDYKTALKERLAKVEGIIKKFD